MLIGKIQIKRRVWVSLVFALTAIGSWWAWTRENALLIAQAVPAKQPLLRVAKGGSETGDKLLRERAEYFDPTPLFFPTALNFGQGPLRESMRRQPGQVFGTFGAKFVSDEQNPKLGVVASAAPLVRLADVVEYGNEAPFAGIGEAEAMRPSLPQRDGFIEVRALRDGKIIVAQSLTGILAARVDFSPLEFMVIVSSAGVVAEPVLMTGSGRDDIDAGMRSYLVQSFRVGERVSPGIYRILIGP